MYMYIHELYCVFVTLIILCGMERVPLVKLDYEENEFDSVRFHDIFIESSVYSRHQDTYDFCLLLFVRRLSFGLNYY